LFKRFIYYGSFETVHYSRRRVRKQSCHHGHSVGDTGDTEDCHAVDARDLKSSDDEDSDDYSDNDDDFVTRARHRQAADEGTHHCEHNIYVNSENRDEHASTSLIISSDERI